MKKLFIRGLRKFGILKRISIYPKVTINDHPFHIPIINETGINNYLHLSESWMQFILSKLLSPETTFLDIGVNLGQTLLKVKAVDKSIPYIGFEPNPTCVNYINNLVSANSFQDTAIYPVGISDSSSVLNLNLFSDDEHDSSASIIEDFRGSTSIKKSINVPVFKFEDISIEKASNIGVIKIDVEGAEVEVLSGIKQHLKSQRPFVLIEILPAYNAENIKRISRQDLIQDLLSECDYSFFRIVKPQGEFEHIEKIESFGIHSDLNKCDYILSPKERDTTLEHSLQINS